MYNLTLTVCFDKALVIHVRTMSVSTRCSCPDRCVRVRTVFASALYPCPHGIRVCTVSVSALCPSPHCRSVSVLCPCPHGIRVRTVSVLALYPCSNGVSVRAVSVSALCLCPHCIRVRSVSVFVSTYSVCQHENTRAIY